MLDPVTIKVIGKSIMLASQSYAIGSVLMSSIFSVSNFSKDQDTLNNAAEALRMYLKVGGLWAASNMMVLGASYGWLGITAAFTMNALIMYWIYYIYIKAFTEAARKYNLKNPIIFF